MFGKAPELWNITQLQRYCDDGAKACFKIDGKEVWVPARPVGSWCKLGERLNLAWKVFTGECDAVYWNGGQ